MNQTAVYLCLTACAINTFNHQFTFTKKNGGIHSSVNGANRKLNPITHTCIKTSATANHSRRKKLGSLYHSLSQANKGYRGINVGLCIIGFAVCCGIAFGIRRIVGIVFGYLVGVVVFDLAGVGSGVDIDVTANEHKTKNNAYDR